METAMQASPEISIGMITVFFLPILEAVLPTIFVIREIKLLKLQKYLWRCKGSCRGLLFYNHKCMCVLSIAFFFCIISFASSKQTLNKSCLNCQLQVIIIYRSFLYLGLLIREFSKL